MATRRVAALLGLFCLMSGPALTAEIVDVADITEGQSLFGRMEHLPDPGSKLTLDRVMRIDQWLPLIRSNQGYKHHPFWTRTQFVNTGVDTKTMILRNPRPGVNRLDVHLVSEDRPVQSLRLGALRPAQPSSILSRHSIVILRLAPAERLTVLTRVDTIGPAELGWVISDSTAFSRYNFISALLFGVFGGMAMTLIFYNLTVWRGLRDAAYLAYSAMALFSLVFQYALNGVFRGLDIGIPFMLIFAGGWMSSGLFLLSVVLFPILFFKTASAMPGMHRVLIVSGFCCCAQILYNVAYLNTQGTTPYAAFTSVLIFAIAFLLLILGIRAVTLRLPGAPYYLLGQGVFQVLIVIQWAVIAGWMELNDVSEYAVMFGTMLDIGFLSVALAMRIRTLSEEKRTYQAIAMAQSRFTSVGKAVGAIVHQWKTPLSRLGTQITELRGYLDHGDPRQFSDRAGPLLSDMDQSMEGLKQTLDEFGLFYAAAGAREEIDPVHIIHAVLDVCRKKINASGVKVVLEANHGGGRPESYPGYFSHALITLIDNALDILEDRKTPEPEIRIRTKMRGTSLELSVEDNGGGIRIRPVQSIFIPFVSHKKNKGSGMGLAIARMAVEERLGGEIIAENTSRGARFTLILPDLKKTGGG